MEKKAFFLISIFQLLLLTSCVEEISEPYVFRRVIHNLSGTPIEINAFRPILGDEKITIEQSVMHGDEANCRQERGSFDCDLIWTFADSIVVVFNNERKLVDCPFAGCDFEASKSILQIPGIREDGHEESGWVTSREGNEVTQTFTITEEDYQRAHLIGG